jgi:small subunit ribosomal protein S17
MSEQTAAKQQTLEGTVVSSKMDKTIVVAVPRLTRHRKYGRVMRRTGKHKAHDERNECNEGDQVIIQQCRPLSKEKNWRVISILSRAK